MRDFSQQHTYLHPTLDSYLNQNPVTKPLYSLSHSKIETAYHNFTSLFKGAVLYAVKSNSNTLLLNHFHRLGMTHYDVCSLYEINLVRSINLDAEIYYMHPVKSRQDIQAAYFNHHVKAFVVDSMAELQKIMDVTHNADDLTLFVRIAPEKRQAAVLDLAKKFGAIGDEAVHLLQQARKICKTLGVSFHVGSQCMEPDAFYHHIAEVRSLIDRAEIDIEILNVGGGFPVPYEGMVPPPLETYIHAIDKAVRDFGFSHCHLMAEPGRVMNAQTGSLVVQVILRKGNLLYINDGIYGGLFDACDLVKMPYRVRAINSHKDFDEALTPFAFAGPTCDCLDMMQGPFLLPNNIDEGDYIEISNMGVYSESLRSNFCGFGDYEFTEIA